MKCIKFGINDLHNYSVLLKNETTQIGNRKVENKEQSAFFIRSIKNALFFLQIKNESVF